MKEFQELALEHGKRILKKQTLTPIDCLKLKALTRIIFDVNVYRLTVLTDRLSRSQFYAPACSDLPSQQKSKGNSTD